MIAKAQLVSPINQLVLMIRSGTGAPGRTIEGVRRTRFAQYVGRREFEDLTDGALSAQFEAYRKSEARLILSIIASGALVSLLALAACHAA